MYCACAGHQYYLNRNEPWLGENHFEGGYIHSWISSAKRTQVHLFYSGQVDVRGPVEVKCRWSEDWSSCSYYCGDQNVKRQKQALVDVSPKGSEDMCEKLEGEKHVKPCGENITCTGNTTHAWHKNKLTLILSEPFVFGDWTETDLCTETCGNEGKVLEQRSCTPAHPDKSCASLPTDKTLRLGKACVGKPCQGYLKVFSLSIEIISGSFSKWSKWSACTADCENDPNHAVVTRTRKNILEPNDVRTQEIPCVSPCPPGTNKL